MSIRPPCADHPAAADPRATLFPAALFPTSLPASRQTRLQRIDLQQSQQ